MMHRARVKLLLEMSAEDPLAIIESFGSQIMQEDVLPRTTREFAEIVDSVTTDDVNQVWLLLNALHCVQKKTPTHVFFYIFVENV